MNVQPATTPKADLAAVLEALRAGKSFLILSHVSPDGDALGSMLAMRELLRGLGKDRVECAHPDTIPLGYRWLPGVDCIFPLEAAEGPFDTVVLLDCSQTDRAGAAAKFIPKRAKLVVVDHHLDASPAGDVSFVDPSYAATGEILVDLFELAGLEMDEDAATAAYVAIATDTGGFRYGNTTARTMRAAAKLVGCGIDVAELSERLFERMSSRKFDLLARIIPRAVFAAGGRVASVTVRQSDLRDTGATPDDIEGIINLPRQVETVDVAVLFKETGPATTKISVRAREGFNAAEFCKTFGGGGHAAAAGATIQGPIDDTEAMVMGALAAQLEGRA